jgi:hypothetical protein
LKSSKFPATRSDILGMAKGKVVEGWEVGMFLGSALKEPSYPDLRAVMLDLETWLDAQG